ncbi:MAG: tetratricopeptide repeat protein [Polyangiaceae bacterium]|nr:tetratricopeptide repeat protein [Polyangiaceae bacterium]
MSERVVRARRARGWAAPWKVWTVGAVWRVGLACGGLTPRAVRWTVASIVGTGLITVSIQPGWAEELPARKEAKSAFELGEIAEKEMRFGEALEAYERAVRLDPSAPFVPAASARAEDLKRHSEGGFEPLAALEKVRRDPQKNRDAAAIDALALAAEGFPDGPVRSEARLVAAEAYEHVLGRPEAAIKALQAILKDGSAGKSVKVLALSELVTLLEAKGDLDTALEVVESNADLLPRVTREVQLKVRRRSIARVCLGFLGAALAAALGGMIVRARQLGDVRKVAAELSLKKGFGFAFYAGAGGAVMARWLDKAGDPIPFLALGAVIVGAMVVGRAVGFYGKVERAGVRAFAGLTGVLSLFAGAYWIIWKLRPDVLELVGL